MHIQSLISGLKLSSLFQVIPVYWNDFCDMTCSKRIVLDRVATLNRCDLKRMVSFRRTEHRNVSRSSCIETLLPIPCPRFLCRLQQVALAHTFPRFSRLDPPSCLCLIFERAVTHLSTLTSFPPSFLVFAEFCSKPCSRVYSL